jgi:Xaa-Pro aminopeptidase
MNITTYQQRRQALFATMPVGSVAIIASGNEQTRNRDTSYAFRPASDFYYLTGFSEPESLLVLVKTDKQQRSLLGLRPKNKEREIWDGLRLGIDAAPSALGVDLAFDSSDWQTQLIECLANQQSIWISFEQAQPWMTHVLNLISQLKHRIRQGITTPTGIYDLDQLLHEQRLIKDKAAQQALEQAATITVSGHLAAMRATTAGRYEYQVQAALEHTFKEQGAPRLAFNSIVASGANACILHYQENHSQLRDGDLLLVDAGAEFDGFAGDCTTTYPINGRFSKAQAALYDLVLAAQQAACSVVAPNTPYNQPHQRAVEVISQGLLDLGLLQGDLISIIEQESYKAFYMHSTGHWLGCDVHDVGNYKQQQQWRPLEVGMALTIEPGIYIAPDADVAPEWRGIGIRIEDSVIVSEKGYTCLTKGLPRTRQEIETWMKNR